MFFVHKRPHVDFFLSVVSTQQFLFFAFYVLFELSRFSKLLFDVYEAKWKSNLSFFVISFLLLRWHICVPDMGFAAIVHIHWAPLWISLWAELTCIASRMFIRNSHYLFSHLMCMQVSKSEAKMWMYDICYGLRLIHAKDGETQCLDWWFKWCKLSDFCGRWFQVWEAQQLKAMPISQERNSLGRQYEVA